MKSLRESPAAKGGKIRGWYEKNRRDLPWRRTRDPYRVWISEVILQQTRIEQGTGYYLRFLESFPDVGSLARASLDEVLKVWQGLGYYSRARNLHASARYIMDEFGGRMPGTHAGLLKLKGVGAYTAAAIASICYGEPEAVVDGNVARVIARLNGIGEPVNTARGSEKIRELAREMLHRTDPGDHNQAMMEFGALQCIPGVPDCGACPLARSCVAYTSGRVEQFPVKIPGKKPMDQWIYFFVVRNRERILLEKRGTEGIWRSLYQFPAVESGVSIPEERLRNEEVELLLSGCGPFTVPKVSGYMKHQLSHRTLHSRFIHVHPARLPDPLPGSWLVIPAERLNDYPVPRLINRYMEVVRI